MTPGARQKAGGALVLTAAVVFVLLVFPGMPMAWWLYPSYAEVGSRILWFLGLGVLGGGLVLTLLVSAGVLMADERSDVEPPSSPSELARITEAIDPWRALRRVVLEHFPESLHIGDTLKGWTVTRKRSNLLILGPPSSGKTSGLLVPQILSALGPAVAATTKGADLFQPTAMTRARLGRLWHYNPAGGPLLPGCTELRWSPLTGCEDWETAARISAALVDIVPMDGQKENSFFRLQSQKFLTLALHGCAVAGMDIEDLLDVVHGDREVFAKIEEVTYREGGRIGRRYLNGFLTANDKTRNDIRQTAQNALVGFDAPGGIASAQDPNFDPLAFAWGRVTDPNPDTGDDGFFDTVYVTSPPDDQERLQSLYVALLSVIRRARFDVFETDRLNNVTTRPPMYWALDELGSLAPMKRFPQIVSQSASTGLMIAVALQSLEQANAIWPNGGLLDLFRCVFVFPGIRDSDTLNTIAALGGKQWVEKVNRNYSETYGGSSTVNWETGGFFSGGDPKVTGGSDTDSWSITEGYTTSWHHIDRITPGDVYAGRVGADDRTYQRNYGIYLEGATINPARVLPYYEWDGAPFREVVIGSIHHIANNLDPDRVKLPWPHFYWYDSDPDFRRIHAESDNIAFQVKRNELTASPEGKTPGSDRRELGPTPEAD